MFWRRGPKGRSAIYVSLSIWSLLVCNLASAHWHQLLPSSTSKAKHLTRLLTDALVQVPATGRPPLTLFLGTSPVALRPLRAAPPSSMLVATTLPHLTIAFVPGPTYGPRAGAASVVVLLAVSHDPESVAYLAEELRASALWAARSRLVVILDKSPSQAEVFQLTHILAPFGPSAIVWTWNGTYKAMVRVPLFSVLKSVPPQYMGWPCMESLRKPQGKFLVDIGSAPLAEEVVRRVSELQGAKCVHYEPKGLGTRLPNGSYTGHLADMKVGRTVMFGYSAHHVPKWKYVAELTYPHLNDNLCAEVRRSSPLSYGELIIRIFSLQIYLFIVGTAIIYALVVSYVSDSIKKEKLLSAFEEKLFETLRVLITGCFFSRKNIFKYLWLILSFSSIVLTNAFLGSMTSRLSVVQYHPEIKTLKEVIQNVDEIGMVGEMAGTYCGEEYSDIFYGMHSKCVPVYKPEVFFQKRKNIVLGKRVALISFTSYASMYARLPILQFNRRKLIRLVPECLLQPAYTAFVVQKDLLYAYKIDLTIQHAVQSGLWEKFSKDSKDGLVIRYGGTSALDESQNTQAKPLNINELRFAFFAMGCALILSVLLFALEILIFHILNFTNLSDLIKERLLWK